MQLAHVKLSLDLHVPYTSYAAVSHDDKTMSDKERADYKKAWQLFADLADKNDVFTPLQRGLIQKMAESVQVNGELSPGYVRTIEDVTRVFRACVRYRETLADGAAQDRRRAAYRLERLELQTKAEVMEFALQRFKDVNEAEGMKRAAAAPFVQGVMQAIEDQTSFLEKLAERALIHASGRADVAAVQARTYEAQARVAEARLQKERAEDALADYRASRGRVEDTAEPEPKRVRASIQSDAPRASPSPPEV